MSILEINCHQARKKNTLSASRNYEKIISVLQENAIITRNHLIMKRKHLVTTQIHCKQ